jgi:hypothetical protein
MKLLQCKSLAESIKNVLKEPIKQNNIVHGLGIIFGCRKKRFDNICKNEKNSM